VSLLSTPSLVRGLLPEDPFLETYLVRPGGATVFALGAEERMTVVDAAGGQVAEITVLDAAGRDDAGAVGAKAEAPATVLREAFRDRGRSLLVRELASRGLDPTEAVAIHLFGEWSAPGSSQAFRAERPVTVVVAAPAGRIVDGAPPPSEVLVEVRRTTARNLDSTSVSMRQQPSHTRCARASSSR
jgi:aminomethyltransferase